MISFFPTFRNPNKILNFNFLSQQRPQQQQRTKSLKESTIAPNKITIFYATSTGSCEQVAFRIQSEINAYVQAVFNQHGQKDKTPSQDMSATRDSEGKDELKDSLVDVVNLASIENYSLGFVLSRRFSAQVFTDSAFCGLAVVGYGPLWRFFVGAVAIKS